MTVLRAVMGKAEGPGENWHGHVTAVTVREANCLKQAVAADPQPLSRLRLPRSTAAKV